MELKQAQRLAQETIEQILPHCERVEVEEELKEEPVVEPKPSPPKTKRKKEKSYSELLEELM